MTLMSLDRSLALLAGLLDDLCRRIPRELGPSADYLLLYLAIAELYFVIAFTPMLVLEFGLFCIR